MAIAHFRPSGAPPDIESFAGTPTVEHRSEIKHVHDSIPIDISPPVGGSPAGKDEIDITQVHLVIAKRRRHHIRRTHALTFIGHIVHVQVKAGAIGNVTQIGHVVAVAVE